MRYWTQDLLVLYIQIVIVIIADDVVMITPTAEGMKQLLQMCEVYGFEHDIKYN